MLGLRMNELHICLYHIDRNKYKRVYSDGKQEDCCIENEEIGANKACERDRSYRDR
jgi:hypothetical protein